MLVLSSRSHTFHMVCHSGLLVGLLIFAIYFFHIFFALWLVHSSAAGLPDLATLGLLALPLIDQHRL